MLTKENYEKKKKYWYSCAYFKSSQGQLSKNYRFQKPIEVEIEISGNQVNIYKWQTSTRLNHPQYYYFSALPSVTNFFGNFVFETEEESWESYYKSIEKEIERTELVAQSKINYYKQMLLR